MCDNVLRNQDREESVSGGLTGRPTTAKKDGLQN